MSEKPEITRARFSVGDVIHHHLFNYRGVVADIDPEFQSTDEWYETVAKSRPRKDQPWYHVLVHGADYTTYVAEQNLDADPDPEPVDHPMLDQFFSRFDNGHYISVDKAN